MVLHKHIVKQIFVRLQSRGFSRPSTTSFHSLVVEYGASAILTTKNSILKKKVLIYIKRLTFESDKVQNSNCDSAYDSLAVEEGLNILVSVKDDIPCH